MPLTYALQTKELLADLQVPLASPRATLRDEDEPGFASQSRLDELSSIDDEHCEDEHLKDAGGG